MKSMRNQAEEVVLPPTVETVEKAKSDELARRQEAARRAMGAKSLLAVPLNEDPLWAHRYPQR